MSVMKNFKIETVDELVTVIQVCAWAFVVFTVLLVFGGTVFSMLYSVIFITQPVKTMAPIDQAFTKMLNDIVLLMTGSITTLVGMFAITKASKALANKIAPMVLPLQQPYGFGMQQQPQANPWGGIGVQASYSSAQMYAPQTQTAQYDNSWTPPPGPTNPPHHLEDDAEREALAAARDSTKGQ